MQTKLRVFYLISFLITAPIWFYLIYQILTAINASELMWFLFWVYVPVSVTVGSVASLFEKD